MQVVKIMIETVCLTKIVFCGRYLSCLFVKDVTACSQFVELIFAIEIVLKTYLLIYCYSIMEMESLKPDALEELLMHNLVRC